MASRHSGSGTTVGALVKKLVIYVGLPLAFAYFVVTWRVSSAVDNFFGALGAYANVSHGRTSVGFNGDLTVRSIFISDIPNTPGSISADEVTFHTPGLLWLVKVGLFGTREVPTRLGITLRNAEVTLSSNERVGEFVTGGISGALFDSVGCGDASFNKAELREMGIEDPRLDFTLNYEFETDIMAVLTFRQEVAGSTLTEMHMRMDIPSGGRADPQAAMGASLRGMDVKFTDEGFVGARNAFCAKRLSLRPGQFVDRHVDMTRKVLRSMGLGLAEEDWQVYRRFANSGGHIGVTAVAQTPLPMMTLQGAGPTDIAHAMSLKLVDSRGTDRMFVLQALDKVPLDASVRPLTLEEQVEAEVAFERENQRRMRDGLAPLPKPGSEPVASAAPVDPTAATAPATASPTAPVAAAPITASPAPAVTTVPATTTPVAAGPVAADAKPTQEVPYTELANHIGRPVSVQTQYGTVRTGTLERFNLASISIKLGLKDGGISLSVPANTVKRVLVVPIAAPVAAPATPATTTGG